MFALKKRRPIRKELDRLLRKEFRRTVKSLSRRTPNDEVVHEARKSVKKIRAILRLVRDELGGHYAPSNLQLRTVSHQLSALRDIDALMETIDRLQSLHPSVLTKSAARALRNGLRGRQQAARARMSRRTAGAAGILRGVCSRVLRQIRRAAGRRVVEGGVVRAYRRARGAMRPLTIDSGAPEFHAWRRRAKDHWYHVRLFQRRAALARRARSLRRLERLLGDEHDLDVLRVTIMKTPRQFGNADITSVALGCIDKSQRSLRERALALGGRLFRRKPRRFTAAVEAW